MSNPTRMLHVWNRCIKGSTLGEQTAAYKALGRMLDKYPALRSEYADAFKHARRPETVAHLAVDLFVDTGADGYSTGIDFEMVKSECRVFFATLPKDFLRDVKAHFSAMRKPVKGVFTGDNLKAINGVEYLVEQAMR